MFFCLLIFAHMLVCFTDFFVIGMNLICLYKRHTIVTFSSTPLLTYDDYIDINFEFCVYHNLGICVFDIEKVFKQQPARSDATFDILNGRSYL